MIELAVFILGGALLMAAIIMGESERYRLVPAPVRACTRCGYALEGLPPATDCPECGAGAGDREAARNRIASRNAHIQLAVWLAAIACVMIDALALAVLSKHGNASFAAIAAALTMPAYLLAVFVPRRYWGRPGPAAVVSLCGLASIIMGNVWFYWLIETDPLAVLVVPVSGIAMMGYGFFVGAYVVRLRRGR